jgi:predicted RNase H-like HicB family nuclease
MSWETPSAPTSSLLVQIRPEPDGQFTAELPGFADLHATAATREEAVEQLRALIRQQLDSGSLVCLDIPQENPLLSRFGSAKDDPTFDDYLEEIRKYREEVDRREGQVPDPGECSNTSSIPTT